MYVNVKQHITKSHSYIIRYNGNAENDKVQLYRGDHMIGESEWQYGNSDEWIETWIWEGDDTFWLQINTERPLNQSHFYITKNNGHPTKEQEIIYCKFIKTN
jgi:hypothetical protein